MDKNQTHYLHPERQLDQIFWQVVFSLLVAGTSGVLLYYLWDHLGLPGSVESQWGWWQDIPAGLHSFASMGIPLAAWLPTAALGVIIHQAKPLESPESLHICHRALTLDAATYLLLPGFVLLPVLWRELGNGLAALGFAYLVLWTVKSVLLIWVLGRILAESQNLSPGKWLGLLSAAWVIIFIPAIWIMQTTPFSPREASFAQGALALLPDWIVSVEPLEGGCNLFYGVLLAPFTLFGERLGGVLLSSICGALCFSLLCAWLWRSGGIFAVICAALALGSVPVWSSFAKVGPETGWHAADGSRGLGHKEIGIRPVLRFTPLSAGSEFSAGSRGAHRMEHHGTAAGRLDQIELAPQGFDSSRLDRIGRQPYLAYGQTR